MKDDRNILHVALIGFGEVGKRFARDLQGVGGVALSAFDILSDDASTRPAYERAAQSLSVTARHDAASAYRGADLIISAVTAAKTEEVAQQAASHLKSGQYFLDVNSASPGTKQRASGYFANGAAYVEGAVMAPVKKPGIRVPILAGGAEAETVAARLNALGFNIKPVAREIGRASATKLCRSIVIKGMEALLVDCARASRHAGVDRDVFASLAETFPSIDWPALADDMQERVETHGVRRAEEMREAARMLNDFGFSDELARAIADAQDRGAKRDG